MLAPIRRLKCKYNPENIVGTTLMNLCLAVLASCFVVDTLPKRALWGDEVFFLFFLDMLEQTVRYRFGIPKITIEEKKISARRLSSFTKMFGVCHCSDLKTLSPRDLHFVWLIQ